jgi:hypothetical protein
MWPNAGATTARAEWDDIYDNSLAERHQAAMMAAMAARRRPVPPIHAAGGEPPPAPPPATPVTPVLPPQVDRAGAVTPMRAMVLPVILVPPTTRPDLKREHLLAPGLANTMCTADLVDVWEKVYQRKCVSQNTPYLRKSCTFPGVTPRHQKIGKKGGQDAAANDDADGEDPTKVPDQDGNYWQWTDGGDDTKQNSPFSVHDSDGDPGRPLAPEENMVVREAVDVETPPDAEDSDEEEHEAFKLELNVVAAALWRDRCARRAASRA